MTRLHAPAVPRFLPNSHYVRRRKAENLNPKMSHFPKLPLRLGVIFGMPATAARGNLLVSIARRNN
ncbi:hypothetical protein JI435_423450 [Parastagonospora nodorum SN15]|uniref:Uncharacterized protein n=1 Tax=Phaeosphaeria nodorum (strain SN15 / ATCC MYA-4574 / FGSC 10173) TaxID=321614 RepID=A0A7U2IB25_PHANO|nr:hypothetical protein JI435_423450 [Parastagonospora nodorum SN15]